MIKIPQTIIEELIKRKVLDKKKAEDLSQKAKSQDKDFSEVIVGEKIISDSDLLNLKSELYRLPSVTLKDERIKPDVLKILPEDFVNFYKVAPFDKEGSVLKVGIINPEDTDAL